jgi:hypothetical protein
LKPKNSYIIIYFFVHALLTNIALGQETSLLLKGTQECPYELSLLVEEISSRKYDQSIKDRIQILDSLLEAIPKQESLVIIKAEIYKRTLDLGRKSVVKITQEELKNVNTINVDKNCNTQMGVFLKWLCSSVTAELISISSSIVIQNDSTNVQSKETSDLKKIKILFPLFQKFSSLEYQEVELYFSPMLETILNSIISNLRNMHKYSFRSKKLNERKNLYFFEEVSKKALSTPQTDQIAKIDNINNLSTTEEKTPERSDWMPNEQNLIVIKPDPNYIPPAQLPKPSNDWFEKTTTEALNEENTNKDFNILNEVKNQSDPDDNWYLDE